MKAIDPSHADVIRAAVGRVNAAVGMGLPPVAEGFALLGAIEALQADLRAVLEAERRRQRMCIVN